MKKVLKVVGSVVLTLVLLGAGGFVWAQAKTNALLNRSFEVHSMDFPIPFPLDPAEIAAAGFTPEQADSAARARALDRGRHLIASRYVCTECHGTDFGGGVMIDDPMIGTLLGPNITAGPGGRTSNYGPVDWDRIVRHGVLPDGLPAAMPSQDFMTMSDEELSDIVTVIRSMPLVDAEAAPRKLGPLGTVLVATGQIQLAVDVISDQGPHANLPPEAVASAEFGSHLAGVCAGCHRRDFSGGKVPGGDPSWPPAANLTPIGGGLGDWSYEQFTKALTEGVKPDGSALRLPMDAVVGFTSKMTDTELEALWAFLRSLPAKETEG